MVSLVGSCQQQELSWGVGIQSMIQEGPAAAQKMCCRRVLPKVLPKPRTGSIPHQISMIADPGSSCLADKCTTDMHHEFGTAGGPITSAEQTAGSPAGISCQRADEHQPVIPAALPVAKGTTLHANLTAATLPPDIHAIVSLSHPLSAAESGSDRGVASVPASRPLRRRSVSRGLRAAASPAGHGGETLASPDSRPMMVRCIDVFTSYAMALVVVRPKVRAEPSVPARISRTKCSMSSREHPALAGPLFCPQLFRCVPELTRPLCCTSASRCRCLHVMTHTCCQHHCKVIAIKMYHCTYDNPN